MKLGERPTTATARTYWFSAVQARERGQRRLMRAYAKHAVTLERAASVQVPLPKFPPYAPLFPRR